MLCKYCEQLIYKTKKEETFPGNGIWSYLHGKYRHIKNDMYYCIDELININNPNYIIPICPVCKTETDQHGSICSACGFPPHKAWNAADI